MLLGKKELEASAVVANRTMNRQRQLDGPNSYGKDLRFDLCKWIDDRLVSHESVKWLDLCCGTGLALAKAKERWAQLTIVGVDLVPFFDPSLDKLDVTLHVSSIEDFPFDDTYDLITCVHGLHYVGDKLQALSRAMASLSQDGLFIANINLTDIHKPDGRSWGRYLSEKLEDHAVDVQQRRKMVACLGPRKIDFELNYCGADDTVGPNYTGQPVVCSVYQVR